MSKIKAIKSEQIKSWIILRGITDIFIYRQYQSKNDALEISPIITKKNKKICKENLICTTILHRRR